MHYTLLITLKTEHICVEAKPEEAVNYTYSWPKDAASTKRKCLFNLVVIDWNYYFFVTGRTRIEYR